MGAPVLHPLLDPDQVADRLDLRPVLSSTVVHDGMVWDVVRERVDLGPLGGEVTREFVRHTGAVAVVCLDDEERMLVIHQYRHPVTTVEWELPAGLLDVPGEDPCLAAQRELAEEADLVAREWHVLVDHYASPGGLSEALRIFLARDLAPVPEEQRHVREGEEAGMPAGWLPLDEVTRAVLDGRLHNPSLLIGSLAARAAREAGWASLRPADAAWPWHPAYR